VSADRGYDREDVEPSPGQPAHAGRDLGDHGEGRGRSELGTENEGRDHALGELAAENADLHKRVGSLEAELKSEKARFSAWAGEIATRDDERAARDEARDKREEALADRIAELEQRHADRPAAADPGGAESRIGAPEAAGRQVAKRNPERLWRGNEAIATYTAGAGVLLTTVGETAGSTAADVTGLVGSVAGLAVAAIALARKHREESHADRPER
jgi:hypothetical protein